MQAGPLLVGILEKINHKKKGFKMIKETEKWMVVSPNSKIEHWVWNYDPEVGVIYQQTACGLRCPIEMIRDPNAIYRKCKKCVDAFEN